MGNLAITILATIVLLPVYKSIIDSINNENNSLEFKIQMFASLILMIISIGCLGSKF